jgi:hypothetical protein
MYLDNWMIVTLILSFGICAYVSRNRGFMHGATATLQALEEKRFIKIDDDGEIKRWTPYTELNVKKTKKKG